MDRGKFLTKHYDELPLVARILIQIFAGAIISCAYRVLRYIETRNTVTLVVAIIAYFTGIGAFILWITDIVTLAQCGAYTCWVD